jgi:SAM-dependent methyltransferase
MQKRTPARTLDTARYAETFATFVGRSLEYPAMSRRLVEAAATCPEGFACLDVGAGPGKVLRDWLAHGGRRPGRYVAIEPNAAHAASLRQALAALTLAGDVLEASFDPRFAIAGTYDLVLFSHSLYWMRDPVGCVRHARAALAAGGFCLVFLQSPIGIHPFFHLFEPLLERDRPSGADQGFSSHELVHGLRQAGLDPQVIYDRTPIDLTGLFDPGAERERDELISFCLQVEFAELPEPLTSDAIEYLRIASVEENGRLRWYEPTATIRV